MTWTKCTDRLPPLPATPYKPYLVWCSGIADGFPAIAHLCRKTGRFIIYDRSEYSPLRHRITHWAQVVGPGKEK